MILGTSKSAATKRIYAYWDINNARIDINGIQPGASIASHAVVSWCAGPIAPAEEQFPKTAPCGDQEGGDALGIDCRNATKWSALRLADA
jgi:hypothetical protein